MQTFEQYLQSKTLRVSKLVGMELQTRSGDNLGEVDDVARSAAPGTRHAADRAIGGIGADEKLIAIPFDEIQISADGDELYTNRTREQLAGRTGGAARRTRRRRDDAAQRSAADANRDAANRGARRTRRRRAAATPGAATRAPRSARSDA